MVIICRKCNTFHAVFLINPLKKAFLIDFFWKNEKKWRYLPKIK